MKKKILFAFLLTLALALVSLLAWNLTALATVTVDGLSAQVSFSESWQLRSALRPKKLLFYIAGCPFSTEYAVSMGGLTYCISLDDCETVWVKEPNLYYTLSREDHDALEMLIREHWNKKLKPAVSERSSAIFQKQGEKGYKRITGEIASLYTFDSLRLRPVMEWGFDGDWLYRILLDPGKDTEMEILIGEKNLSINGKVCYTAEGVPYEEILNWVNEKYAFFDYPLVTE